MYTTPELLSVPEFHTGTSLSKNTYRCGMLLNSAVSE
jgi:hypothetical protein